MALSVSPYLIVGLVHTDGARPAAPSTVGHLAWQQLRIVHVQRHNGADASAGDDLLRLEIRRESPSHPWPPGTRSGHTLIMRAALPAITVIIVVPVIVPVTIAMIVIRSTISAVVPTASVVTMVGCNDAPAKQRHGGDENHKNGLHMALLFSLFPSRAYALDYRHDVGTRTFRSKTFSYSERRHGAKQSEATMKGGRSQCRLMMVPPTGIEPVSSA